VIIPTDQYLVYCYLKTRFERVSCLLTNSETCLIIERKESSPHALPWDFMTEESPWNLSQPCNVH